MKNPLKEWADTVRRFHGQTVGVLGDFMLDELLRWANALKPLRS